MRTQGKVREIRKWELGEPSEKWKQTDELSSKEQVLSMELNKISYGSGKLDSSMKIYTKQEYAESW